MIDTNKYEETDHPELVEFEGETLGDTLTNLLTEVKRLREQNQLMLDYFWFMRNGGFTDADDLLITINKWIDEEE